MSQSNSTSGANKNSWLEIVGIFGAILIIFLIWVNYPRLMQNMDKPTLEEEKPRIVIPFKAPQPPDTSEQKTQFEKIGEKYGTYGDSYGSLNTLFSGLAFAILIISLFMQRQELQAQRQELEAQRKEISESNKIAEGQRVITKQQAQLIEQQIKDTNVQNFYNTLFKFLEEKQRKISLLELNRNNDIKGEYIFDRFIRSFKHGMVGRYPSIAYFENVSTEELNLTFNASFSLAKESTKNTLLENEIFEYIIFILQYIELNEQLDITEEAIKIFISYQSFHEMFCMFLQSENDTKLKEYVIKFSLLRKVNTFEDTYLNTIIFMLADKKSYKVEM